MGDRDEYYTVIRNLPEPYCTELAALAPQQAPLVQEVRLRCGQPVLLTVQGRLVPCLGYLPGAVHCAKIDAAALRECFLALCRHSVYAYEEELEQGYFTMRGGHRVGVAGIKGPVGFARVTSLNLRVARWITCALPPGVLQALETLDGGILVAGAPGSGKTTFLRSMAAALGKSDRIAVVIDERGELMNAERLGGFGVPACACDIYTRCPKAQGILMALRTMNPQAVICDELGSAEDAAALEAGIASGAVFFASVHCDALQNLDKKPQLARLLATGAFKTAVLLHGKGQPGRVERVVRL